MNSRPCRILIVDDNEMNRDMLARRLERKGYVIRVAEGAQSLLERIQEEPVDLVLLDVEMPGISGLDALQTLRERYSRYSIADHHGNGERPERGHRQGTELGGQRLSYEANRFPRRFSAHPDAAVAQEGGRGIARERGTLCLGGSRR